VILALTCRDFDFEKVGYDGVTQEEVYDVSCFSLIFPCTLLSGFPGFFSA
jgi:hypothetical protein